MKVKTLLNKLHLKEYQTIRVLDDNADYFMETTNKKEIIDACGRSSVVNFQYSKFGDCFIIHIGTLRAN